MGDPVGITQFLQAQDESIGYLLAVPCDLDGEVEVIVNGTSMARGRRSFAVTLGEHLESPCRFQVPFANGREMVLLRRTWKGGEGRFEEPRRFRIRDNQT